MIHRIVSKVLGHVSNSSHRRRNTSFRTETLESRRLLATLQVNINDNACRDAGPVYCEIADALADAQADQDTIHVADGTYSPFNINTDGITIEAAADADVIIDAEGRAQTGIRINSDGVTMTGLTVENNRNRPAVDIQGDNNTLIGNSTRNTGGGFLISGQRNTLRENTSADSDFIGFWVTGSAGVTTSGHTLMDNIATGHDDFGFSISNAEQTLLEGNTTSGNRIYGFAIGNGSSLNTLRGNVSSDNEGTGYWLGGEAIENTIENNVARGNRGTGFDLGTNFGPAHENVLNGNLAIHNSIRGFRVASGSFQNRLEGNTAIENGTGFVGEDATTIYASNECRGNSIAQSPVGEGICVNVGQRHVAGDSNGDGVFDSSDLTLVFQSVKYETGLPATYAEGDWNNDGLFDSGDLISAFQSGLYEQPADMIQDFEGGGAVYHLSDTNAAGNAPTVMLENDNSFVRLSSVDGDNNALSFNEFDPVSGPAPDGKILSFDFRLSGELSEGFEGGFGTGYYAAGPWGLDGSRNPGAEDPDTDWDRPAFAGSVGLGFRPQDNTISLVGFEQLLAEVGADSALPFDLDDGNFHRSMLTVKPNPTNPVTALFSLDVIEDVNGAAQRHHLLYDVPANINLAGLPLNRVMSGAKSQNGALVADVDNVSVEYIDADLHQGFEGDAEVAYHLSHGGGDAPVEMVEGENTFIRISQDDGANNAVSVDEHLPVSGPAPDGKILSFDFRLSGDVANENFEGGFGAGYFAAGPWGTHGGRNPGAVDADTDWDRPAFPGTVALGFRPQDDTISLNGFENLLAEVGVDSTLPFDMDDGNFHRAILTVKPNPANPATALFSFDVVEDVNGEANRHPLMYDVPANINLAGLPRNRVMAGAKSVNGSLQADIDNFNVTFLDANLTQGFEQEGEGAPYGLSQALVGDAELAQEDRDSFIRLVHSGSARFDANTAVAFDEHAPVTGPAPNGKTLSFDFRLSGDLENPLFDGAFATGYAAGGPWGLIGSRNPAAENNVGWDEPLFAGTVMVSFDAAEKRVTLNGFGQVLAEVEMTEEFDWLNGEFHRAVLTVKPNPAEPTTALFALDVIEDVYDSANRHHLMYNVPANINLSALPRNRVISGAHNNQSTFEADVDNVDVAFLDADLAQDFQIPSQGTVYHLSNGSGGELPSRVVEDGNGFMRLQSIDGSSNAVSLDEHLPVSGPAPNGKVLSFNFRLDAESEHDDFSGGFGAGYFAAGPWDTHGTRNPGFEDFDTNWDQPAFAGSVGLGFQPKENMITLNGFEQLLATAEDLPFDLDDGNFHQAQLTVVSDPNDATKAMFTLDVVEDVHGANVSHRLMTDVPANINLADLPRNRVMAGTAAENGSVTADVDDFRVTYLNPPA